MKAWKIISLLITSLLTLSGCSSPNTVNTKNALYESTQTIMIEEQPVMEEEVSPQTPLSDAEAAEVLKVILEGKYEDVQQAVEKVILAKDQRFIPVFIELLRAVEINIHPSGNYKLYSEALVTLSGQDFENNYWSFVEWYGKSELTPPPGFTVWKGELLSGMDQGFMNFFTIDNPKEIRVEEILWGGVYVDGIPALDHTPMLKPEEQDYLEADDLVFGISLNGDSRAFPLKIMDWHEMANDTIGGVPVTLAYCTLCGSGIAYKAELPDGTQLNFGSSGLLYRSNKLMFDRQTHTLWNHLNGKPVLGELADEDVELEILPMVLTRWEDWLAQHPSTLVLDKKTGHDRVYNNGAAYGDYFSTENTMFPVWQRSQLLEDKEYIYALEIDGIPKAWPVDLLAEESLINDQLAESNLVLLALNGQNLVQGSSLRVGSVDYLNGAEVRVYQREEYEFKLINGEITDQNGVVWLISEENLKSPKGETLSRVNGHLAYWFGWYSFYPHTLVYGE